jgi:hypothetical protein
MSWIKPIAEDELSRSEPSPIKQATLTGIYVGLVKKGVPCAYGQYGQREVTTHDSRRAILASSQRTTQAAPASGGLGSDRANARKIEPMAEFANSGVRCRNHNA